MRTANEMNEFAIKNDFVYGDYNALKHFVVIEKNLQPDEEVWLALAPNSVYNGSAIVMGGITAVAFTNRRVIYGQKAIIMGEPVKTVNLDVISDVHKDTYKKSKVSTESNSISAPTSSADEILKFKGLLDLGIITQEEFDIKKKQLLGI